jgi:hypothetical protein
MNLCLGEVTGGTGVGLKHSKSDYTLNLYSVFVVSYLASPQVLIPTVRKQMLT